MAAWASPALPGKNIYPLGLHRFLPSTTPGEQLDSPRSPRYGCHGNAVSSEGARSPQDSALFLCSVPSGTPWRHSCSSLRPTSLSQVGCRHPEETRVCRVTDIQRLPAQSLAESRGARNIARLGALCLPPLLTLFRGAVFASLPPDRAGGASLVSGSRRSSQLSISGVGIMAATATMATSGSARKRLLKEEDMTKVEFETSEEVDVTPTFDTMGLREDLLRGIYAYGGARASGKGRLGDGPLQTGWGTCVRAPELGVPRGCSQPGSSSRSCSG